jgi:hypothetical protein
VSYCEFMDQVESSDSSASDEEPVTPPSTPAVVHEPYKSQFCDLLDPSQITRFVKGPTFVETLHWEGSQDTHDRPLDVRPIPGLPKDVFQMDVNDIDDRLRIASVIEDAKRKKQENMQLRNIKKKNKALGQLFVSPEELLELRAYDMTKFYEKLNYTPPEDVDDIEIRLAITHTSKFAGRQTNELLALLGDVQLKLEVIKRNYKNPILVQTISDFLQSKQSNKFMSSEVEGKGLLPFVKLGNGTTVIGTHHRATVYEALFAAIHNIDVSAALEFASAVLDLRL